MVKDTIIRKVVQWDYTFKGKRYSEDKVTFTKEMLIDYIGESWYDFYFDENDRLRNVDQILVTARELGKSFKVVVITLYLLINDPLFNAIWTRKYSNVTGSLFTFLNKVCNNLEDYFHIRFFIRWTKISETAKGNNSYKVLKEKSKLTGSSDDCLFYQGKTKDGKQAIFYDINEDKSKNQLVLFRSSDDPNGNRGISCNVGCFMLEMDEEFAQEEDDGKVTPEQQLARYKSLAGGAVRYLKEQKKENKIPADAQFKRVALANGWDPSHGWIEELLETISEEEWRKYVAADPANNYIIVRYSEKHKKEFVRATPMANLQLYPIGSDIRREKLEIMINALEGDDEYDKAQELGFTFPGFLNPNNPIITIIQTIQDLPDDRKMSLRDFKKKFGKPISVHHGTDWGLSDATCDVPAVISEKNGYMYAGISVPLWLKNKGRKKGEQIRYGQMKNALIEHWKLWKQKSGLTKDDCGNINFDSAAKSVMQDLEDNDLATLERYNGTITGVSKQPRDGYGLEDRPDELASFIENKRVIFLDGAEEFFIRYLKTLEPLDSNSKQPHPRKGEMDIYDALCMLVWELRMEIAE